tara:strand:+ start:927 stop:1490 length:564 start_codon:yes stop_codon:yes gene_type:complete
MGRIGQKIKSGLRAGLTTVGIVGGLYLGYKNAFDDDKNSISPVVRVENIVDDVEGARELANQKLQKAQEEAEKLKNAGKLDKLKAGAQIVGNDAIGRAGRLEKEKAQRIADAVADRQTPAGQNNAGALDQANNDREQARVIVEGRANRLRNREEGLANCENTHTGRSISAKNRKAECKKNIKKKYPK